MALILRRSIEQLGSAVLGMPLGRYATADRVEHTDAADGDGPAIPGAKGVIASAKAAMRKASKVLGARIHRHSREEFERLGIDLRKEEPELGTVIDNWRDVNVDRVESLLEHERDELSTILSKGSGKTVDTLRGDIQDRLNVSRSKADLLARDQTLKLNAQVTRERQMAAGIDEYIWTTSKDERVREMHEELEGERFRWDDPPVTNKAGDRNHPGEDYQCRCVAFPVLPELDDEDD